MTRDRETRRAHPPDFDSYDDDAFNAPSSPSALYAVVAEGWISDVLHEVKSGKEATVYCCRAQPRAGVDLVAAKVYRSRHRRTFKNDAIYRKGRVIGDKRVRRAVERKTAFGREAQFGLWVGHEWATLSLLHAAGADVPRPITRSSRATSTTCAATSLAAECGPTPRDWLRDCGRGSCMQSCEGVSWRAGWRT